MRWAGKAGRKKCMEKEIDGINVELWVLDGTYEVVARKYSRRCVEPAPCYPLNWKDAVASFNDMVRALAANVAMRVLEGDDEDR